MRTFFYVRITIFKHVLIMNTSFSPVIRDEVSLNPIINESQSDLSGATSDRGQRNDDDDETERPTYESRNGAGRGDASELRNGRGESNDPNKNPNTSRPENPPSNPNTEDDEDSIPGIEVGRGGRPGGQLLDGDKHTTSYEDVVGELDSLWSSLLGVTGYANNDVNRMASSIFGYVQSLFNMVRNGGMKLDNVQTANLATQLFNVVSGFVQMQLQTYYSRENWLFENTYNSPINQISRLIEAGINPAFYYDSSAKDTSGSIGNPEQTENAFTGVEGVSDKDRMLGQIGSAVSMLGTAGNVVANMGNLSNLVAQSKLAMVSADDMVATRTGRMAQTWANMRYLTSQAQTEDESRPLKLAEMRSISDLNNATCKNYLISQAQRWQEIENDMRKFDRQIESSQFIADLQAKAQRYSADKAYSGSVLSSRMAFLGTKYSADKNLEGMKYSVDENIKNSRWLKNMDRRMGLELKAMDRMYDEVNYTSYIDETTGERLNLGASAGLGFAVQKGIVDGTVSFGADNTTTVAGHRIRKDEIHSNVFNYGRMQYANQTILNLVRYNDENFVPSATMFHYAEEFDNVFNRAFYNWALPKASAAFGAYTADYFRNIGTAQENGQGVTNTYYYPTGLQPGDYSNRYMSGRTGASGSYK